MDQKDIQHLHIQLKMILIIWDRANSNQPFRTNSNICVYHHSMAFKLGLANRLTENVMPERIQVARYIRAPIVLRYDTS